MRGLGLDVGIDLSRAANLAVILGVIFAGIGYAAGQWRRGRDDQRSAILGIANDELDLLKASRDRMAAEARDRDTRIAKLEAIVEQLQRENGALRELVMLETIPPALEAALAETGRIVSDTTTRLHEETRRRIIAELRDTETRLAAIMHASGT